MSNEGKDETLKTKPDAGADFESADHNDTSHIRVGTSSFVRAVAEDPIYLKLMLLKHG